MLPYFSILSFSALAVFLAHDSKFYKFDKIFIFLLFIVVSLFLGYRSITIGPDWWHYKIAFENQINFSFIHSLTLGDPAYFGLTWLVRRLTNDILFVNILMAIITLYFYYIFCKYQKFSTFSFFIGLPFLILFTINFPRQAAAMTIIAYSLKYILAGNKKEFFIFILLATLFHKTAFIFLALLIDDLSKFKIKNLFILSVIGSLFFFIFIYQYLEGYILNFSTYMHSNAAHLKGMIYVLPVAAYFIFYKQITSTMAVTEIFVMKRLCIIIIFSYFLIFTHPFLYNAIDRIFIYFLPIEVLIFGNYILSAIKKNQVLMYMFTIIIYKLSLFYIWLISGNKSSLFLPFEFYK
jgi:hypothetical protein